MSSGNWTPKYDQGMKGCGKSMPGITSDETANMEAKMTTKVPPRAEEDYVALCQKIFVGAIPRTLSEDAIWNYFTRFGVVTRVEIKTDRAGQPKGFGFVTFETLEGAQAALDNHDDNFVEGKWLDVKNSSPSDFQKEVPCAPAKERANPTGCTLRAQGLPFKISPREILVLFRDYNVLRATTTADKFGRPSGIAIVEFSDPDSCMAAFVAKQGVTIEHRYIELFDCNEEYMRRAHPMNTCSAQELWGWSQGGPSSLSPEVISANAHAQAQQMAQASASGGSLGPLEEFLAGAGYGPVAGGGAAQYQHSSPY